jgi:hypothetical protein
MNNHINNKWREAFNTPVPEWNKTGTWDRIEQTLPPRRSKFFYFASKSTLALFITLIVFSSLYHNMLVVNGLYSIRGTKENLINESEQAINLQTTQEVSAMRQSELQPSSSVNPRFEQPALLIKNDGVILTTQAALDLLNIPKVSLSNSVGPNAIEVATVAEQRTLTPMNPLPIPLQSKIESDNTASPSLKKLKWASGRPPIEVALVVNQGVAWNQRQLQAIGIEGGNFVQYKRDTEKVLETSHSSAMLQLTNRRQWQLSTGITYQRTAHWFNFESVNVQQQQVPSDSASFFNFNGNQVFLPGQVTQTVTTITDIRSPSSLHRLFIPIQVGYEYRHRRSAMSIQTGILLNIWNRYSGFSLDPEGVLMDKNSDRLADLYRAKGVHALSLALSYKYQISPKWSIATGVFTQHDLSSLMRPATQVDLRYRQLGVNLALNYRLKE